MISKSATFFHLLLTGDDGDVGGNDDGLQWW